MRTRLIAAIAASLFVFPILADDKTTCVDGKEPAAIFEACGRLIASESESAHVKAVAYASIGLAHRRAKDFKAAETAYSSAIDLEPTMSALFFNRGVVRYAQGDPKSAIDDFTRAIQLDPSDPQPLINRAIMYFEGDDYAPALADMDAAIKLSPKTAMLFTYRAKIHLAAGNADRAIADFKQVLKLEPANDEAKAMLKDLSGE
ncbi:MAG TPA: tetratricopeptide repeat protein [Thermoanaerobaculia bacterium]|nr:tetratricopeptide repeat protein [Thermoanaerobaculia bacterium]